MTKGSNKFRVAYIGVGTMGAPLAAAAVRAGCEVVAFDRSAERLRYVEEFGVETAGSLKEAVSSADIVSVVLMADADVEGLETEGLLSLMKPGSGLIMHSTVRPETCIRLAEALHDLGMTFLDAAVSGTIKGAYAGELTVMVGGDRDLYDRSRFLFDEMGEHVFYLGEQPGMGVMAKIINNGVNLCNLTVLLEAAAIAEAHGLDPMTLMSVISVSSGSSFWSQNFGGAEVFVRDHPLGDAVIEAMMVKDIGLAADLAGPEAKPATLFDVVGSRLPGLLRASIAAHASAPVRSSW
jgi:3-hydroxyisobutyrate dehydrogenase-like beta-hydroxyacid dehydrogenase